MKILILFINNILIKYNNALPKIRSIKVNPKIKNQIISILIKLLFNTIIYSFLNKFNSI